MWKTASASPPSGGRPRLVARDHTHKRTLHKDRKGGDLFFFTHLTVERCPFLFIYLFMHTVANAIFNNAPQTQASSKSLQELQPHS